MKSHNQLNTINYNEYTKMIKHWNPYVDKFNKTMVKNNQLYILGPENDEELQYLWNFSIKYISEDHLIIYSMEVPSIHIEIQQNMGKINYKNEYENYRDIDLVKWMLEIMKNMGCEQCILQDIHDIPLCLIYKLWKGTNVYEDLEFLPYDQNHNLQMFDENVYHLQKMTWNSFQINEPKWIKFKEKYSFIYPSPFLAFKEFSPNNNQIFYDILSMIDNEEFLEVKNSISKCIWIYSFL